MAETSVRFSIKGVRALLMHASRAANPLSQESKQLKAVTSKKNKTDEDYIEIARLDWYNGFYYDKERRPILTADCIQGMIIAGATKLRMKKQALAGVIVTKDSLLIHDHPVGLKATIDDFWNAGNKYVDLRCAGVQTKRIMRYRPRFNVWAADIEVNLYDFNVDDLERICHLAGRSVGICDYRPRFGLFEVTDFKEIT